MIEALLNTMSRIFETLTSEEGGLFSLALSAFLSSTVLPGGSEVLLLWLAKQGAHSLLVLLSVASLANAAGGFLTYWMGRWAEKGVKRVKQQSEPSKLATKYVSRWGYLALLFSWLPVIGDGFCLAAGWLRLPYLPSLITIFIGKLMRYGVLLYVFTQTQ